MTDYIFEKPVRTLPEELLRPSDEIAAMQREKDKAFSEHNRKEQMFAAWTIEYAAALRSQCGWTVASVDRYLNIHTTDLRDWFEDGLNPNDCAQREAYAIETFLRGLKAIDFSKGGK